MLSIREILNDLDNYIAYGFLDKDELSNDIEYIFKNASHSGQIKLFKLLDDKDKIKALYYTNYVMPPHIIYEVVYPNMCHDIILSNKAKISASTITNLSDNTIRLLLPMHVENMSHVCDRVLELNPNIGSSFWYYITSNTTVLDLKYYITLGCKIKLPTRTIDSTYLLTLLKELYLDSGLILGNRIHNDAIGSMDDLVEYLGMGYKPKTLYKCYTINNPIQLNTYKQYLTPKSVIYGMCRTNIHNIPVLQSEDKYRIKLDSGSMINGFYQLKHIWSLCNISYNVNILTLCNDELIKLYEIVGRFNIRTIDEAIRVLECYPDYIINVDILSSCTVCKFNVLQYKNGIKRLWSLYHSHSKIVKYYAVNLRTMLPILYPKIDVKYQPYIRFKYPTIQDHYSDLTLH